jgi:hypothetical protein
MVIGERDDRFGKCEILGWGYDADIRSFHGGYLGYWTSNHGTSIIVSSIQDTSEARSAILWAGFEYVSSLV